MVNLAMMMMISDRSVPSQMVVGVLVVALTHVAPVLVQWLQLWLRPKNARHSVTIRERITSTVFGAVCASIRKHQRPDGECMVVSTSRKRSTMARAKMTPNYLARYVYLPVTCPIGKFDFVAHGTTFEGVMTVEEKDKRTSMELVLSVPRCAAETLDAFIQTAVTDAWVAENTKLGAASNAQLSFVVRVDEQANVRWHPTAMSVAKTFATLWLPQQLDAAIRADLDAFVACADFYRQRAMPHKRGLLFYGPPGTGKTSCIYALAEYLHYDVYRLNVRECATEAIFTRALRKIKDAAVVVIEEVDLQLAEERPGDAVLAASPEDAKSHNTAKLAVLMEYLDGYVAHTPGTVVVFTTNHMEDIPPALIRPGRIDRHFHFPPLSGAEVAHVARQFTGVPDLECPPGPVTAAHLINTVLLPNLGDEAALRAACRGIAAAP
jgi:hypothetical protein